MAVCLLEFSDFWLLAKEALVLDETVDFPLKTKSNLIIPGLQAKSLGTQATAPSFPVDNPPPGHCLVGDINWSTLYYAEDNPGSFPFQALSVLCQSHIHFLLSHWESGFFRTLTV